MNPSATDLWFLPLGGCGEIGMNLNLYGHNEQWLMVDCGVTFSKVQSTIQPSPAPQSNVKNDTINNSCRSADRLVTAKVVQYADPEFIVQRKDQLAGMIITHAHEDHVGAVPYIWPKLSCPLYTTAFTAEVLRRKLARERIAEPGPIIIVDSEQIQQIGPFRVQWIALTHSIPEPYGVLIETETGGVFHTADWKLDHQPVVGKPYDVDSYKQLAARGIRAVVCDSTNALTAGHSVSEGALQRGLNHWVGQAKGRVVVTCFSSNIARLRTICEVAAANERHVGLLGYSLQNMVGAARATGHWPDHINLADAFHLGYLPPQDVLLIATGSQGESNTALARLVAGTHKDIELTAGDTVIFSSRVIPGNEEDVERLLKRLGEQDILVVDASDTEWPVHASGHPCQQELQQLYQWIQPDIVIPVHGEADHMRVNADIAKAAGVRCTLTGSNGDLFRLGRQIAVRRQMVKTGRLCLYNRAGGQ